MSAQQKKGHSKGFGKSAEGEQRTKATILNLAFVLSTVDLLTSEATLRDA